MLASRFATSLLIGLLAVGTTLPSPDQDEPPESDGGIETQYSNNGHDVGISGTKNTGGSDSSDGGDAKDTGGNSGGGGSGDTRVFPVYKERTFIERVCLQWASLDRCLFETFPDATPEEIEEITAMPAITITDLERFAPAGTPIAGEPDNLGIAGLPTNFVAEASAQTQSGDLFGFPIQVRFTPATYTFHYGDGASDSGDDGGASWESLSQAQFTPTATSHTYPERGTYDARVDVAYSAEIDLGSGWFTIDGHLNTTGPTQQIRIFEAHTALVANTCAERPSAPGC